MRRLGLGTVLAVVVGTLVLATPAAVRAQNAARERTSVVIDYVSVDGIYLPVGADDGLQPDDTIPLFSDETTQEASGYLVLTSVTRRRSVAVALDPSLGLARGDQIFLDLVAPSAVVAGAAPPRVTVAGVAPVEPGGGAPPSPAREMRISGRIALDLDARQTHTAWTGDLFGNTRRRFATPTTRLSLVASDLPGGLTLRTNLRAAYRYDDLGAAPPPLSIRAYELSAEKTFDVGLPVEIMAGRFSNPYETYSSYWDGALIRVGGRRGLGVGAVVGFEPNRYDEGFSTDLPKLTAFVDFTAGGSRWRYDTDLSVHSLRPTGGDQWSYVGWTQRVSLGPLDVSQRLRLDGGLDGRAISLADLRVRADLALAGPLGVHAAYGRIDGNAFWGWDPLAGTGLSTLLPTREEISGGVDLRGAEGSVWLDVGQSRRDGYDAGRHVSANGFLNMGGGRLLMSGQVWKRSGSTSVGAAPGVAFSVWGMQWSGGYRLYRTSSSYGAMTTNAVDAQVGMSIVHDLRVTLRAERQWGANLSGDRIQLSLRRSF